MVLEIIEPLKHLDVNADATRRDRASPAASDGCVRHERTTLSSGPPADEGNFLPGHWTPDLEELFSVSSNANPPSSMGLDELDGFMDASITEELGNRSVDYADWD
jgi:hypothetical protein